LGFAAPVTTTCTVGTCTTPTLLFSSTIITTSSTRNDNDNFDVSSLLYQEHEKMLVDRGIYEGKLMAHHTTGLAPNVVRGTGGGGGFGSNNNNNKASKSQLLKTEAKAHAQVLRDQGVVRIDNVLPPLLADEMRDFVMKLRKDSEELVASGKLKSKDRFADVLLKKNRCDVTLPMPNQLTADCLVAALQQSAIGETISALLTKDAVLYELSCLISDPESNRQNIHPDTPCAGRSDDDPVLYTCFMALQDIHLDMGPTTWMPGTHTLAAHEQFQDDTLPSSSPQDGDNINGIAKSPKDELLVKGPVVLGLLPKGSCGIFDSRLLHCGGANTSTDANNQRAVFYFSWKNPTVTNAGNPGSIRPAYINKWTLQTLSKELTKHTKGKSTVFVNGRDSFES
jgi:ectoine hydroxylase-related dioxygenase (phytanoyl-CoA dioxygenase family)